MVAPSDSLVPHSAPPFCRLQVRKSKAKAKQKGASRRPLSLWVYVYTSTCTTVYWRVSCISSHAWPGVLTIPPCFPVSLCHTCSILFFVFFPVTTSKRAKRVWTSPEDEAHEKQWRVTTRSTIFRSARRLRRSTACRRSSRAAALTIKSTSRCSRICVRTTCSDRLMAMPTVATRSAAAWAWVAAAVEPAARRSSSTTRSRPSSWVRSANPRARCSRSPVLAARPSRRQDLPERRQVSRRPRRT